LVSGLLYLALRIARKSARANSISSLRTALD
jgi:hypothetical protein